MKKVLFCLLIGILFLPLKVYGDVADTATTTVSVSITIDPKFINAIGFSENPDGITIEMPWYNESLRVQADLLTDNPTDFVDVGYSLFESKPEYTEEVLSDGTVVYTPHRDHESQRITTEPVMLLDDEYTEDTPILYTDVEGKPEGILYTIVVAPTE